MSHHCRKDFVNDVDSTGGRANVKTISVAICVAIAFLVSAVAAAQCSIETLAESPVTDPDTRLRILEEIGNAENQILVAMHEISDEELATALILAYRRGVDIYVMTDAGQHAETVDQLRRMLVAAGIPAAEMSQSTAPAGGFVVIDQRLVITGGRHWFEDVDASEYRHVVVIECAEIVSRFVDEFTRTANDLLGLRWAVSLTSQGVSHYDPCLECLNTLNESTQADFEECSGIDANLAFLLEMYGPYNVWTCSKAVLITILLGIPGLDPDLAESVIDCICDGILD